MDGAQALVYTAGGLVLFIVYIVIVAQLPTLADGNVSGPLSTIGMVCFSFGVLLFLAISWAATKTNPEDNDPVKYFLMFTNLVVALPLALFSGACAVSAVADAKKTLSQ
jgi:hypothetical protein